MIRELCRDVDGILSRLGTADGEKRSESKPHTLSLEILERYEFIEIAEAD